MSNLIGRGFALWAFMRAWRLRHAARRATPAEVASAAFAQLKAFEDGRRLYNANGGRRHVPTRN